MYTIIVSANHQFQEPVRLMVVRLPSPLASQYFSHQHMIALLEHLQPELEREGLTDFYDLRLLFLPDGVPTLEQVWSRCRYDAPVEGALRLPSGVALWKAPARPLSLKTIVL